MFRRFALERRLLFPRGLSCLEEAHVPTTSPEEAHVPTTHLKGDFKMRSKTKRNSKNHFQSYKSLDQILQEISDPEELLEVQEFLETPIDELPEEVTSLSYFRRFAD